MPPGLPAQRRAEWQLASARYQRACGCEAATAGAAIGFVLALGLLAPSITQLTAANAALALACLITATVAGAAIGKRTGLVRARRRFASETSRLMSQVMPASPQV